MGVTINNKSTTTEPPPQNVQQPKPPGGFNAFYWYQIFALDYGTAHLVTEAAVRSKGVVMLFLGTIFDA